MSSTLFPRHLFVVSRFELLLDQYHSSFQVFVEDETRGNAPARMANYTGYAPGMDS